MQEDIARLIELQKLDLEIYRIERALAEVPQSLQRAKRESEIKAERLNKIEATLEEKGKQKKLFEEELQEEQKRLKQTQTRLTQIRGSREYQVLLREIEEMKRTIRQKEEEILKMMEEIETLEKDRDKILEELREINKILEAENNKFEEFKRELEEEKKRLLQRRSRIIEKISAPILKKYELISQKKGGIGIAGVDNGVCEGCFMAIPPQLYNELQKDNRYYECPHCKRLIYYKKIYHPEEKESPPKEVSSKIQ
ncbi:MAG: C4-type zinc ribbon domain-containing protein [Caldimicrobium sp.]|nr:C4-type zinc ribbon domain-containing protein [Caldimicrobium sp.]MCX7873427.1 C4-type zinc ribbon domain-containing protein [Caldimicrobium sp.]MDW8094405.1 C4-type zinc ribbon domain-containing protein [Caldimicrobium sp.]